MIQLSLAAAIPHGPVRPAAPAPGAAGGFALPGAEQAAAAEAGKIQAPGRQILAAPGKTAPEDDVDAEAEGDEARDGADIAFAWFALPIAPQPAPAVPLGGAPRLAATGLEGAEGEAPSLPIAGDGTGTETVKPALDTLPATETELQSEPAPLEAEPVAAKLRVAVPVAQPAPAETPVTTSSQLAAALFAATPVAATPAETRRTLVQDLLPAGGPAAFADIVRPHAVAAAADVQQGLLDMRRQEWAGQMIDQLEAMRDASRGETRLSLAPEALGKIDVSIRQEGDRIHVHFATETQAARQLLTEAQPRLSELAEARGVKLGQTSVDGGGPGQGSARQPQQVLTPRPSAPRAAETLEASDFTNERIA